MALEFPTLSLSLDLGAEVSLGKVFC